MSKFFFFITLTLFSTIVNASNLAQILNEYSQRPTVTESKKFILVVGAGYEQEAYNEDRYPTKKDCQGRHCSAGGFMIYSDNQLRKIYTSTQFQDWIKKYNLESSKIPYEFSIGYIQEQSTSLKNVSTQHFIRLEYID